MSNFESPSRRKALQLIAVAAAGGATTMVGFAPPAHAEDLPVLGVDDPIAMALGYQPKAEDVDTQRFPKRAGAAGASQFCDNCSLYAAIKDGRGTCSAVPGKLVEGKGWCNAWIPVR